MEYYTVGFIDNYCVRKPMYSYNISPYVKFSTSLYLGTYILDGLWLM